MLKVIAYKYLSRVTQDADVTALKKYNFKFMLIIKFLKFFTLKFSKSNYTAQRRKIYHVPIFRIFL